ncbi:MAG: DUF1192 domain-containing protein [Pseudomonadota bacterium]|nr:DUF1192 domain-containing protein [Pseudomonadota bacterium]|tara:strand:+ start:132 stop:311 length:180 start_codon:yes stop_codon:yes gene_type:complete
MEIEESEISNKKKQPKDLTILSIEDLKEYINDLEIEIKRAESMINIKEKARQGAESVFK